MLQRGEQKALSAILSVASSRTHARGFIQLAMYYLPTHTQHVQPPRFPRFYAPLSLPVAGSAAPSPPWPSSRRSPFRELSSGLFCFDDEPARPPLSTMITSSTRDNAIGTSVYGRITAWMLFSDALTADDGNDGEKKVAASEECGSAKGPRAARFCLSQPQGHLPCPLARSLRRLPRGRS